MHFPTRFQVPPLRKCRSGLLAPSAPSVRHWAGLPNGIMPIEANIEVIKIRKIWKIMLFRYSYRHSDTQIILRRWYSRLCMRIRCTYFEVEDRFGAQRDRSRGNFPELRKEKQRTRKRQLADNSENNSRLPLQYNCFYTIIIVLLPTIDSSFSASSTTTATKTTNTTTTITMTILLLPRWTDERCRDQETKSLSYENLIAFPTIALWIKKGKIRWVKVRCGRVGQDRSRRVGVLKWVEMR